MSNQINCIRFVIIPFELIFILHLLYFDLPMIYSELIAEYFDHSIIPYFELLSMIVKMNIALIDQHVVLILELIYLSYHSSFCLNIELIYHYLYHLKLYFALICLLLIHRYIFEHYNLLFSYHNLLCFVLIYLSFQILLWILSYFEHHHVLMLKNLFSFVVVIFSLTCHKLELILIRIIFIQYLLMNHFHKMNANLVYFNLIIWI